MSSLALSELIGAPAIDNTGLRAGKVREVLTALGLIDGALYVERATQARERVARFADIDPASVPYFAMALVRRNRE